MALINLFFQTRAKIGQMELDASMSESHELSAEVTKTAIEDGSDVGDNVKLNPRKLTIEGVVSKSPLGAGALIGALGSSVAGVVQAQSAGVASKIATIGIASIGGLVAGNIGPDGPTSREPSAVWDYINEIWEFRDTITVITKLKTYDDMIITGVTAPRSIATTNLMRFNMTLEQVTIVSSETVDLGSLSELGGAASPSKNLGTQSAEAASAKTADNSSILYQAFGPK